MGIIDIKIGPLRRGLILMRNIFKFHQIYMFNRIEFDIYNMCNRKCSYCPNALYEITPHKMSEELFKKIVDELSNISYAGEVTFCRFGEPMLDDRLGNFVKYIKSKCPNCFIRLFTNGDFLDYNKFKELLDDGVDFFDITNHSNILTEFNKQLLERSQKDKFSLRMGNELKVSNRGGLLNSKKDNTPCFVLRRSIAIDSYGKMVLCFNDYFSSMVFGDLNKEKLIDVWKSNKIRHYRNELAKGNRGVLDICSKCDFRHDN